MEHRLIKLYSKSHTVPLKVLPGHFATNHSHVNFYIDITTLKTRVSEAEEVARTLAGKYMMNTVVDTIVCLDGTQVIGALLAQELTRNGLASMNAHNTIYVVTPELDANGQLLFRDNLQPMVRGKHVLILIASATTGITIRKSAECVQYYGGEVAGMCAIFSAVKQAEGHEVHAVFHLEDVPEYQSFAPHDCPLCKAGMPIEALVNQPRLFQAVNRHAAAALCRIIISRRSRGYFRCGHSPLFFARTLTRKYGLPAFAVACRPQTGSSAALSTVLPFHLLSADFVCTPVSALCFCLPCLHSTPSTEPSTPFGICTSLLQTVHIALCCSFLSGIP